MTSTKKEKTPKTKAVKSEKKSLIGTDPLEWLEEGEQENNAIKMDADASESDGETEDKKVEAHLMDLGESLNIRELADLHQRLLSSIENGTEVTLDASQIEKADAVSLQTLAAFYQSGPSYGINVKWSGCSDAFKKSSELLGLSETLGIDSI